MGAAPGGQHLLRRLILLGLLRLLILLGLLVLLLGRVLLLGGILLRRLVLLLLQLLLLLLLLLQLLLLQLLLLQLLLLLVLLRVLILLVLRDDERGFGWGRARLWDRASLLPSGPQACHLNRSASIAGCPVPQSTTAVPSPCPDGTVILEDQGMVASRNERGDTGKSTHLDGGKSISRRPVP